MTLIGLPLRQEGHLGQSRVSTSWTLSRQFHMPALHSTRRPPLRRRRRTPARIRDGRFLKTRDQHHSLSPYNHQPTRLLLDKHSDHVRQECPHRGSCRYTSLHLPLLHRCNRTTPPYIPRQHVQLDEQPVSVNYFLFATAPLWKKALGITVGVLNGSGVISVPSLCLLSSTNRGSGCSMHHVVGMAYRTVSPWTVHSCHTNATLRACRTIWMSLAHISKVLFRCSSPQRRHFAHHNILQTSRPGSISTTSNP